MMMLSSFFACLKGSLSGYHQMIADDPHATFVYVTTIRTVYFSTLADLCVHGVYKSGYLATHQKYPHVNLSDFLPTLKCLLSYLYHDN